MKVEINGSNIDLSAMLLSAERYALGRRTYIVQWTCEFIANNLHLITKKDKQVMIRDIKWQGERDFDNPYGDECDKQEWLKLLQILERKVKENG